MMGPKISGNSKLLTIQQAVSKVLPKEGEKLEQISLNTNLIEAIRPSVPPKDVYIDMINGSSYKIPDVEINLVTQAYRNAMK